MLKFWILDNHVHDITKINLGHADDAVIALQEGRCVALAFLFVERPVPGPFQRVPLLLLGSISHLECEFEMPFCVTHRCLYHSLCC